MSDIRTSTIDGLVHSLATLNDAERRHLLRAYQRQIIGRNEGNQAVEASSTKYWPAPRTRTCALRSKLRYAVCAASAWRSTKFPPPPMVSPWSMTR